MICGFCGRCSPCIPFMTPMASRPGRKKSMITTSGLVCATVSTTRRPSFSVIWTSRLWERIVVAQGTPKYSLLSAKSTLIFFSTANPPIYYLAERDYHKMENFATVWKMFFLILGENIGCHRKRKAKFDKTRVMRPYSVGRRFPPFSAYSPQKWQSPWWGR